MTLKNRKRREDRPKTSEPLTTITTTKSYNKTSPSCYRFSEYDKAEIALGVANLERKTNEKVTPAKLIRALVRLNNIGVIDESELITMINSL